MESTKKEKENKICLGYFSSFLFSVAVYGVIVLDKLMFPKPLLRSYVLPERLCDVITATGT